MSHHLTCSDVHQSTDHIAQVTPQPNATTQQRHTATKKQRNNEPKKQRTNDPTNQRTNEPTTTNKDPQAINAFFYRNTYD